MQDNETTFSYRPRPFAPEASFVLGKTEIIGQRGSKQVRVAYRDIETVRLLFKPRHINLTGFKAIIYARSGLKMMLEDVTYKSLVEQQRLEKSYGIFIRELCRRVDAANPRALFYAGKTPLLHWVTAAAGVAGFLAMMALLVKSLSDHNWPIAVGIIIFSGYFAFWSWHFVRRNKPQPFDGKNPPPEVMPEV